MNLLNRIFGHMPKKHDEHSPELIEELRHLRHILEQLTRTIMIAQTTFDTSLANLTGAVNNAAAALAASNSNTSTPDTVVQAYIAGVDAQTVALAAATPPQATPGAAAAAVKK